MSDAPHVIQVVAALIHAADGILLVHQQGHNDPAPLWALPGGVVEPGETLLDALNREIREETGLAVTDPGRLLYVTQVDDRVERTLTTIFVFEVAGFFGDVHADDPNGFILEAQFLNATEAISRLSALPWPAMRDPAIAAIRGHMQSGSLWLYRRPDENPETLIGRFPMN